MESRNMFLGKLVIKNNDLKKYICNSTDENGDYCVCDIYDLENNLIIKRVWENVLTGDEMWRFDKETQTFAYFQKNKFNTNGLGKYDTMLCNYFRWQPYSIGIKESMFQGNDAGEVMFKFYDKTDVKIFKEWVKEKYSEGNPVEILFVLQNPILIAQEKIYNTCVFNKLCWNFSNIHFETSNNVLPNYKINRRRINREK